MTEGSDAASRGALKCAAVGGIGDGILGFAAGWSAAIHVAGLLAVAIGGFGIINSAFWRGRKHWSCREMRLPLALEFAGAALGLLLIGALDLVVTATWWLLLISIVYLLLLALTYEELERWITRLANKHQLPSGTAKLGASRPLRIFGNNTPLREVAKTDSTFPLLRLLHRAFEEDDLSRLWRALHDDADPKPSLTRRIIVLGVAATLAATGVAFAGNVAIGPPTDPQTQTTSQAQAPRERGSGASPTRVSPRTRKSAPPASPSSTRVSWNGQCRRATGSTAPAWARQEVEDAILGTGGYGTKIDGCLGKFTESSGSYGRVAYAYGLNPVTGAQLSLIVASDLYGAAVYLAPAIASALGLLHDHGVIGGPPRISIGPGDAYLVDTPAGTAVLIRTDVSSPGRSGQAAPYQLLPPSVAALWVESMHGFGSWLWPIITFRKRSRVDFHLVVSTITNNAKYTIVYDTRTRQATAGDRHLTGGASLSTGEVLGLWSESDNATGWASPG